LRVKGVTLNALVLDEMNILIVKHYVMNFSKKKCDNKFDMKKLIHLKKTQAIVKWKGKRIEGHNFSIWQNNTLIFILMQI
jgi:hypothetical protein